ncbi:MAG: aminotransferase [Acetobacterium woodii]|nr:aminotransferase [Acetobacterium woodii]
MNIKPFKVEEWMNEYEDGAVYNLAETCVDSISLDQLFELTGTDKETSLSEICRRRLTYGDIWGAPAFKKGICQLYKTIGPENIITTHGAAGANHHIFYSIIQPGDRIISVIPTYQQLYAIPESFEADVQLLKLQMKDNFLPDLAELRRLATPETKLICINNPNNPTGALMSKEMLTEIVEIARSIDAYLLCDEVYRGLTQDEDYSESVADLYDKGISVSSMSKVFSLAGLRLGWIATKDQTVMETFLSHRDYTLISCGMLDETIGAIALNHAETLLARSKAIVRENLSILDDWIKTQPHITYLKPQAGTTALLCYDFEMDSYEFCKDLYHQTGVFLTPGECFEEEQCVRIGYASDKQTLIDGLNALGNYLTKITI